MGQPANQIATECINASTTREQMMAAPKTEHEDRAARRQAMFEMRQRGMSYSAIGRKFKVCPNTPRAILFRVYKKLGITDAKPAKVVEMKPIIAIRAVNIIDLVPEMDQDGNVVMKEEVARHRFEFKREGSDIWEDVEITEERPNA